MLIYVLIKTTNFFHNSSRYIDKQI